MTATLLWGKEAAAEIRAQAKERFDRIAARGVQPGLAIVTVGETPAGNPYVRSKSRAAQELGVRANIGEPAAIDRRLAAHPARALHFLHSKTHAAP